MRVRGCAEPMRAAARAAARIGSAHPLTRMLLAAAAVAAAAAWDAGHRVADLRAPHQHYEGRTRA
jgi:hypothetical protein